MASNTIHVVFDECDLPPANGYRVLYRPAGSLIEYREWPLSFPGSPAVFLDTLDPLGTQYEGIIMGDCGDGKYGVPMPWATEGSGTPSSSVPESSVPPAIVCKTYRVTASPEAVGSADFSYVDCDGNGVDAGLDPGTETVICADEGSIALEQPLVMAIELLGDGCLSPNIVIENSSLDSTVTEFSLDGDPVLGEYAGPGENSQHWQNTDSNVDVHVEWGSLVGGQNIRLIDTNGVDQGCHGISAGDPTPEADWFGIDMTGPNPLGLVLGDGSC